MIRATERVHPTQTPDALRDTMSMSNMSNIKLHETKRDLL